jgi:hypothetical protein
LGDSPPQATTKQLMKQLMKLIARIERVLTNGRI